MGSKSSGACTLTMVFLALARLKQGCRSADAVCICAGNPILRLVGPSRTRLAGFGSRILQRPPRDGWLSMLPRACRLISLVRPNRTDFIETRCEIAMAPTQLRALKLHLHGSFFTKPSETIWQLTKAKKIEGKHQGFNERCCYKAHTCDALDRPRFWSRSVRPEAARSLCALPPGCRPQTKDSGGKSRPAKLQRGLLLGQPV